MLPAHLIGPAARAASSTPMYLPPSPGGGRYLLADGDGLAYYCAGSTNTDPARAKQNLLDKLRAAKRQCGADKVIVLCTSSGSDKGGRYAVARVKPYQGQRTSARRPANWEVLRAFLEAGHPDFTVQFFDQAEADDGFSFLSRKLGHERVVILTQDKDMRMVPGYHMVWDDHRMFKLRPGTFSATFNDNLYGDKWFWTQLLTGDTADNIPGLPWMMVNGKQKRVGAVAAASILADCANNAAAGTAVLQAYRSYYGIGAELQMMEQASLLWMRNHSARDPLDVCQPGNPMYAFDFAAQHEIAGRVNLSREINAQAQDN